MRVRIIEPTTKNQAEKKGSVLMQGYLPIRTNRVSP